MAVKTSYVSVLQTWASGVHVQLKLRFNEADFDVMPCYSPHSGIPDQNCLIARGPIGLTLHHGCANSDDIGAPGRRSFVLSRKCSATSRTSSQTSGTQPGKSV